MINEFVINEACGQKLKILFTHSFGIRFCWMAKGGGERGRGFYFYRRLAVAKCLSNYEWKGAYCQFRYHKSDGLGQRPASLTLAFPPPRPLLPVWPHFPSPHSAFLAFILLCKLFWHFPTNGGADL